MEHKEAEQIQAADRYLLGALSADERERFEQHFFSCPECAEDVKAGMLLSANARVVFQEEERREEDRRAAALNHSRDNPGWLGWLTSRQGLSVSWAMACVLAIFAGYQSFQVVPRLETQLAQVMAPQSVDSALTLLPVTRALRSAYAEAADPASGAVIELDANQPVASLQVLPSQEFEAYQVELRGETGDTLRPAPAKAKFGEVLSVRIPAALLSPGAYTLVLRGLDGIPPSKPAVEIETYNFVVKRK